MRLKLFCCTVMIGIGLCSSAALCQVPCANERKMTDALSLVREQLGYEAGLEATQLPDLTRAVIYLKVGDRPWQSGVQVPVICFYAVKFAPFELRGNTIVPGTIQVDADSEWIVAIDGERGIKTILEGGTDPIGQFNKFVESMGLQIANSENANDLLTFFWKAVFGRQYFSRLPVMK
jgi:hypothetical protein